MSLSDSELSEVDLITSGNSNKTVNIEKTDSDDELSQLKTELKFKDSQIKELQNNLKDLLFWIFPV